MTETPPRVRPHEIADLASWALSLDRAGARADPGEQAEFLAAKADLLARIADQHAHEWTPEQTERARHVAEQAAQAADDATSTGLAEQEKKQ